MTVEWNKAELMKKERASLVTLCKDITKTIYYHRDITLQRKETMYEYNGLYNKDNRDLG